MHVSTCCAASVHSPADGETKKIVQERIHDKSVYELPWIGEDVGPILDQNGYTLAQQVLGMFLMFNEDDFKSWLSTYRATSSQQERLYRCLEEWFNNSCRKGMRDDSWRGIDETIKESLRCSTALQVMGLYLVLEDGFATELANLDDNQIEEC